MANDTSAVVAAQPVRDPATARRTLEIAIATLAVASLILQHGFELWRRFGQLFNWLDVLLAFGLVTILLAQLMTAKRWQDAIQETNLRHSAADRAHRGRGCAESLRFCYDRRQCPGEAEMERVSFRVRLLQRGICPAIQQPGSWVERPCPQCHDCAIDRAGRARVSRATGANCVCRRRPAPGAAFAASEITALCAAPAS